MVSLLKGTIVSIGDLKIYLDKLKEEFDKAKTRSQYEKLDNRLKTLESFANEEMSNKETNNTIHHDTTKASKSNHTKLKKLDARIKELEYWINETIKLNQAGIKGKKASNVIIGTT